MSTQPPHPIEYLNPRSLGRLSGYLTGLLQGRLWAKVMLGMALGLSVGLLLGPTTGLVDPALAITIGDWLAFPGKLFLAAIQMMVIPLVFASIIRGLASSENIAQLKTLGIRVTLFFVLTTALAAAMGLGVAGLIGPGESMEGLAITEADLASSSEQTMRPNIASIPDKLLGLVPGNPLNAMVKGEMLQVVIFSIVFGIALVSMAPAQSRPMLDLLGSLQDVCMTVVRWTMLLAPFAVFGLMAQLATKIGIDALLGMAIYVMTVCYSPRVRPST